jgi:hypothetical protein
VFTVFYNASDVFSNSAWEPRDYTAVEISRLIHRYQFYFIVSAFCPLTIATLDQAKPRGDHSWTLVPVRAFSDEPGDVVSTMSLCRLCAGNPINATTYAIPNSSSISIAQQRRIIKLTPIKTPNITFHPVTN